MRSTIDDDSLEDEKGEPFSLSRLGQGLAIGTNNADIFFLDPTDNFSVWLFHFDGLGVERLASTFGEWLLAASIDELEAHDNEDCLYRRAIEFSALKPVS